MTSTIPHLPIFVEDDDIENGSRTILKLIRPDCDLEKIRYKVKIKKLKINISYYIVCDDARILLYICTFMSN